MKNKDEYSMQLNILFFYTIMTINIIYIDHSLILGPILTIN